METKKACVVTLKKLNEINNESIKREYNCTIRFDVYSERLKNKCRKHTPKCWDGLQTKVFLQPMMVHTHKRMELCEPHMRAAVCDLDDFQAFIDVPMDMWEQLEEIYLGAAA